MIPKGVVATLSPWEPGISSLVLYALMVLVLIGVMLFLSGWLGEKKKNPEKSRPYECGVIPTGTGVRHAVPFYLVAAFFVVFDVEAVFIFAWAIVLDDLGWAGWLRISFFIILLLASLIYVWEKGGLDWGSETVKKTKA